MRQNRVKKVMREGKLAFGAFVELADPQVVEIIGLAGFDAAFIDMEHSNFDLPLVGEMIRAADLAGITSVVRIPGDNESVILRLLDMGAEGLVIPHIQGVEGAKRMVDAVRYAPLGQRGAAGGSRATRFGTVPWQEHTRQSNEEVLLSVMTEDAKGINDIEKIAALDGIDLVAIGPMDFSEYMGIRDPNDPRLKQRVAELAGQIKKIGKAKLALPVNNPAIPFNPQELLELGVGYANVGPTPPVLLMRSLRQMAQDVHAASGQA